MDEKALMALGGVKAKMTEINGKDGMRRSPSRDELYDAIDIVFAAIAQHGDRIKALEGKAGGSEA